MTQCSPVFYLLCFSLTCCPAFGQQHLHTYDQFDRSSGLTAAVHCMAQDAEGFLWLGSSEGLFRFDGLSARKVDYLRSDTFPDKALRVYALAWHLRTNQLWIGTGHGIFVLDLLAGTIAHLQAKDYFQEKDLDDATAEVLFVDRQGEVWADFAVSGLTHLTGGGKGAKSYSLPSNAREIAAGFDESRANKVRSIAQDANDDHILWMTANKGLMKFDKATGRLERFFYYPKNGKMMTAANTFPCIFPHPNGFIYIGTWDAGLLRFDPGTGEFAQFFRTEQGWTEDANRNRVRKLLPDGKGNLWTDGSGGACLFDVKNERFLTPPQAVLSLDFKDRQGNYWNFNGGLRLYHPLKNQLEMHPVPDEVACTNLTELPFSRQTNEVFLRSHCQNGLWALHSDKLTWQHYPLPGRAGEKVPLRAFGESLAGFYVSDERDGLFLRPAGEEQFRLLPVTFPDNPGNLNLAVRSDGDLFITGHKGLLFWLKPGAWELKSYSTGSPDKPDVGNLDCASWPVFDHLGRLWMRTCEGFCIFFPEEDRFLHVSKKSGRGKHLDSYRVFVPDEQNRMWASGDGGFGWIDPLRPEEGLQKHYSPKKGFPDSYAFLAFAEGKKIWMQTDKAFVEFDTETERYRYYDFLGSPGVSHRSLGDGRALTFKNGGYFLYHLDSLRQNEEVPQPYVSWFKVFEKPLALSGGQLAPDEIRLEPGENFFSFGFSALAWYDAKNIRFAYRLDGVNKDWIYPEEGILSASYNNVDGGDYVLKIKTTDSQGVWLGNAYELHLHVGTPWWKTWWARLSTLALVGAVLFLIVKNRFRQQQILLENHLLLLEKETSLRIERDRIASEMHDDLGAGLSTIRFLSLTAKEKESDPAKAARIDKIASHAAHVMEKMADIIWVMNSRNDSLENLCAYLRRYAGEYLDLHGIRLRFEAPGTMPSLQLSGEQRRTLLLSVKECLHNIVKHAGASEAGISIQHNGALEIEVSDNGRGIPQELLERFEKNDNSLTGNGLFNLRNRMKEMGGELRMGNGNGTTVRLKAGI